MAGWALERQRSHLTACRDADLSDPLGRDGCRLERLTQPFQKLCAHGPGQTFGHRAGRAARAAPHPCL